MIRSSLKWLLISLLTLLTVCCSDNRDPVPDVDENNLVSATLAGTRSAAELQLLIVLAGRDLDPALFAYDVDIYKVIYKTVHRDSEIEASGLILLPKTTTPAGMLSFQRGTIVKQSDAPSLQSQGTLEVISYAAIASMGFITVVPDMIGFGASQEIFHPYYVEEPTAAAVIHNLLAARNLASEKQVAFNNKLFSPDIHRVAMLPWPRTKRWKRIPWKISNSPRHLRAQEATISKRCRNTSLH